MTYTIQYPRSKTVSRKQAPASLLQRALLSAILLFLWQTPPIPTLKNTILVCFLFSMYWFCAVKLFCNTNIWIQIVFPKAKGGIKMLGFLLLLLFPIGELHVIRSQCSNYTVYPFLQFTRYPDEEELMISLPDSMVWWLKNDYITYMKGTGQ